MDRHKISRRKFLSITGKAGIVGSGLAAVSSSLHLLPGQVWAEDPGAPEARYWVAANDPDADCGLCHAGDVTGLNQSYRHRSGVVKCLLCAHECTIAQGDRGKCRVRENVNGSLRSLVYGRPAAIHIDPIEKKPFYHFLPGAAAYSIGTAGCPLRCRFCQNWELASGGPEDVESVEATPSSIVRAAVRKDTPIIAFTYNEPTVFFEYMMDIAQKGRPFGLRHVMISCGFMNPKPLEELCGRLDAIKIDLKGYSEKFYRDVCGGELKPVLRSIRTAVKRGVHVEIVNLVVPTLNDAADDLRELCKWVAGDLGPDIPVHFTRFHPDYRMLNLPPTPVSTLERAREIALEEGLHYPFVGNVPGHPGNHTYCPSCGGVVIERMGYHVDTTGLKDGRCAVCGGTISGVWS